MQVPEGKTVRRKGKTAVFDRRRTWAEGEKGGSGTRRAGRKGTEVPFRKRITPRLRALDAGFFDLVQQRFVTHAEQHCRLTPVPVDLSERFGDHGTLGVERRLTRDVGQAASLL